MKKFPEFEASLLGMLVDKCGVGATDLSTLLEIGDRPGRQLVRKAIDMKLVDEGRITRLISQYWELPFVNVKFPYRRFLMHFKRPIDDLLAHDLLPLEFEPSLITVVSYYVPSPEVVDEIEQNHAARLRVYIGNVRPVCEALVRLRDGVVRFKSSKAVDCGEDKELFFKATDDGWPATVREKFAGATVRTEFDQSRKLTKTVEKLDPSEPDEVRSMLLGKSMSRHVPYGRTLRKLAGDFVESVGDFDGELSEAILKLRIAQIVFDNDKKE